MKVADVIDEVMVLADELEDVDGLAQTYQLTVDTNGDDWNVNFLGHTLVGSEDNYDCEIPLKEQIVRALKDIKGYLDIILKGK